MFHILKVKTIFKKDKKRRTMKLIALKKFRDKETKVVYKRGDEITHFGDDRATSAIYRGLVKKSKEDISDIKDKKAESGNSLNLGAHWRTIVSDVKAVSDVEKLKEALAAEKAFTEPRDSVIKAIEERIAELESL